MNNINLISGVSSSQFPRFKQKNKAIPNTSYITPDVTMMGLDANASYNMYKKYNCTEKLNIPILSPIKIEEDLDKIDGKKSYNQTSGQTKIVQTQTDGTIVYTFETDGSYTYEEYDNCNNLLYCQSKSYRPEGEIVKIIKETPSDNVVDGQQALYINGNLKHVSRFKKPSVESKTGSPYEDIGYNTETKNYYIEKCDKDGNKFIQKFDNNLKPLKD